MLQGMLQGVCCSWAGCVAAALCLNGAVLFRGIFSSLHLAAGSAWGAGLSLQDQCRVACCLVLEQLARLFGATQSKAARAQLICTPAIRGDNIQCKASFARGACLAYPGCKPLCPGYNTGTKFPSSPA